MLDLCQHEKLGCERKFDIFIAEIEFSPWKLYQDLITAFICLRFNTPAHLIAQLKLVYSSI